VKRELVQLVKAEERLRAAERQVKVARSARDAAITIAVDQGVPQAKVASALGVTVGRVNQLLPADMKRPNKRARAAVTAEPMTHGGNVHEYRKR
jgi:hypothetical protein